MSSLTTERNLRTMNQLSDFRLVDENHSKELLQGLNALRKTGTFCDVFLKVNCEHRGCPAHRHVLAAFSPYFKALYAAPDTLDKDTILEGLDSSILEGIVDYIYTGALTLTTENAQDIFEASILLQLETLQKSCARYLEKCLTPQNSLPLMLLAEKQKCRDLSEKAREYIGANFSKVVDTSEFESIGAKDLKAIISNDCLMVKSENEVFQAVKKWMEHDFEKRLKYVPFLMSQVRFRFMPREFLTVNYTQDSIMSASPLCRDFVHEALMYETLPPEEQKNVHTSRVKARWYTQSIDAVLLVGGSCAEKDQSHSDDWAFDPVNGQWYTLAPLLSTRHQFGLTQLADKVYVFGGSVNDQIADKYVATVEVYDPKLNQWKSVRNTMKEARSRFDAVGVGEFVYFVGGMCNEPRRNTLEMYNPVSSEEKEGSSLCLDRLSAPEQPRYDHCTAVLNGKIYFIGGCTRGHAVLKTVECYDPAQNTWSNVAPLLVPRSGACTVVLDNCIVVIGGSTEKKPLDSCEIYDSNKDQWEYISPMNERRDHCSAACFKEKIYVFGGSYGRVLHNSVECYTTKTNTWKVVNHLPASKYGFKCAISLINRSLVHQIGFEQV